MQLWASAGTTACLSRLKDTDSRQRGQETVEKSVTVKSSREMRQYPKEDGRV